MFLAYQKRSHYSFTKNVLRILDRGSLPWDKPWQDIGLPPSLIPMALKAKKIYNLADIYNLMLDKPFIRWSQGPARYNAVLDIIELAPMNTFTSANEYYGELFHLLAHSTGHWTRLNRGRISEMVEYGSLPFTIEESVAEITKAYLGSLCCASLKQSKEEKGCASAWAHLFRYNYQGVVKAYSSAQNAVNQIITLGVKNGEDKRLGWNANCFKSSATNLGFI